MVAAGEEAAARRAGRLVTYGLLVALVVAAVGSLEPWPLSSFRLFSETRSGTRTALVLEAVRTDGTHVPLTFGRNVRVTRSLQRQLPHLADRPEAEQVGKVRAWLELAGLDPATVGTVRVVAIERRLDPHGGPPVEIGRRTRLTVEVG